MQCTNMSPFYSWLCLSLSASVSVAAYHHYPSCLLFTDQWQLLQYLRERKKDYNKSLPSHHQLRIKPSSHLWLYCSMTHTHTRTHTHWICLCAERNDKWAPRFSVARLALRVSGPSALTVSPVKKKRLKWANMPAMFSSKFHRCC